MAEIVEVELSAKTRKLIDNVKRDFRSFSDQFGKLLIKRAELAPRFMKAFAAWQGETAGTFVQFVRTLDPTVPEARADYVKATSYQAADYLRRLAGAQARGAGRGGEQSADQGPKPDSPRTALARILASILPAIGDEGKLWSILQNELHWTANMVDGLRDTVNQVQPLPVKVPKGTELRLVLARQSQPQVTEGEGTGLAKSA